MPWFKAKLTAFPDPSEFKDKEEFTYAALATSAFKKAIGELLGWVDQQTDIKKDLLDKKEGKQKDDPFRIGR